MPRSIILLACVAAIPLSTATVSADDTTDRDVAAVTKFLKDKYPNDAWGRGPTRLTSKAVEAAYPNSRFYYVFSPQYPIARVGQVSAVVQIDGQGKPQLVNVAQDYNNGLMAIHGADDAKTAAAAIMSLMLGPMGPREVSADEVAVAAAGRGWTAKSNKRPGHWEVEFDGKGQCTAASYQHRGPLPICIGGLFRAVAAPQGLIVGSQPAVVGLLVDSVEADSIAQKAGLQKGDLLVGLGDQPLPSKNTIQQMRQTVYALKQQKGVSRSATVLRAGRVLILTLAW